MIGLSWWSAMLGLFLRSARTVRMERTKARFITSLMYLEQIIIIYAV